jgi:hypothetical protein
VTKDELTLLVLIKVLAWQLLGCSMSFEQIGRRPVQKALAIPTTRIIEIKYIRIFGDELIERCRSLEVFSDEIAAAVGPGPREGVMIEHAGHDIVNARRFYKLLALEVVIVRHIQPTKKRTYIDAFFYILL